MFQKKQEQNHPVLCQLLRTTGSKNAQKSNSSNEGHCSLTTHWMQLFFS